MYDIRMDIKNADGWYFEEDLNRKNETAGFFTAYCNDDGNGYNGRTDRLRKEYGRIDGR